MTTKNKPVASEKAKAPKGRPSLFSDKLGDEICAELAKGKTLRQICKDERMPAESTVRAWALDVDSPFSAQYARAREIGYSIMADELLEIADNKAKEADATARDKLRVDTRKWLLSKALPKLYGDKILNEHVGKDGGAVHHVIEQVIIDPAKS